MVNSPLPTNLASECRKAAKTVEQFVKPPDAGKYNPDQLIPDSIITQAKGIAILSVLKAGFLFSGRAGSGLVVARLPDGSWSAPSAIGTAGMGVGGQIGAELTDFVIILNTDDAVKAFSHGGNMTIGGNLSVAAGPLGRNAEAAGTVGNLAAIYSYSKTRGLFAGVSIEGSAIVERKDTNATFYGRKVSAKELLSGNVNPPPQADDLYRALNVRSNNYTVGAAGGYSNMPSSYANSNSNYGSNQNLQTPTYGGSSSSLHSGNSYNNNFNHNEQIQVQQPRLYPRPGQPGGGAQPVSGALHGSSGGFLSDVGSNGSRPAQISNSGSYSSLNNNNNNNTYHQSQEPEKPSLHARPAPLVPSSRAGPPAPPPRAVALYDFAGERQGDLPFRQGDVIVITEKTESTNDWWKGRCNGKEGSFPANYVSI